MIEINKEKKWELRIKTNSAQLKLKLGLSLAKICWSNTGRGESHIPGALHCRSSTCLKLDLKLKSNSCLILKELSLGKVPSGNF